MRQKKPMRPSTVAVLLAVILLMLILSNREQNKTGLAAIPFFRETNFVVRTAQRPSPATAFIVPA